MKFITKILDSTKSRFKDEVNIQTNNVLDSIMTKAKEGLPVTDLFEFKSADDLAKSYYEETAPIEDCVQNLINSQCRLSGTLSFVTNLGGMLTLPITIPASIGGALLIQTRMIYAIMHMSNLTFGPKCTEDSENEKALILLCLGGNAFLQEFNKVVTKSLQEYACEAATKTAGKELSRCFLKNAVKLIPLLPAIPFALLDAFATKKIGNAAKEIFITENQKKLKRSDTEKQTEIAVQVTNMDTLTTLPAVLEVNRLFKNK